MAQISVSITIERPLETVFNFVGDVRNDPQWRTGVEEMTVTPNSAITVGSKTREVFHFGGKVYVTEANITTWKPNQYTAFKSFAASLPVEGARRFEHSADGTRLTYDLTTFPQTLSDKLMAPMLKMLFRSQIRKDLKKLKTMLEQQAA